MNIIVLHCQAAIGDKIHVSSHINAVPYLALSMEQCWLSNTSQVTSHASPDSGDQTLISSGCPTSDDISLHWQKGSSNSAFTFKVIQYSKIIFSLTFPYHHTDNKRFCCKQ